jgi:TRAP-type C4-dicarboxylate transport system permease large subunit
VAKTTSNTEQPPAEATDITTGKGRPTPTRKEVEAARKRPLVSNDRAEARRRARAANQIQRDRARVGLANGEEKYLPVRDRGPQKRFVRDYIDARWSVGEALIPLMLIVIVLTAFPQLIVQTIGLFSLWAFFAIAVLDCFFVGLRVKRKLAEKFGESRVESGVRWYAAMRALQMRIMRMPKPQVKRGAFPE